MREKEKLERLKTWTEEKRFQLQEERRLLAQTGSDPALSSALAWIESLVDEVSQILEEDV